MLRILDQNTFLVKANFMLLLVFCVNFFKSLSKNFSINHLGAFPRKLSHP